MMRLFVVMLLSVHVLKAQDIIRTEWVMHPWSIEHPSYMEVVSNDSEGMVISGNRIEITLHKLALADRFDSLSDFARYLRQLFNLEDPDPIYPFPSPHINSLCVGGYMDISRIVMLAIDAEIGRFVCTAIFDDDDLDAEGVAMQILKTLRLAE